MESDLRRLDRFRDAHYTARVREDFRDFAERQPRAYGAFLLGMGTSMLWLIHTYAQVFGRISIVLVVLVPFMIVFGVQALVLGTKPSALKEDRVTAGIMFALSAAGSALLWRWI